MWRILDEEGCADADGAVADPDSERADGLKARLSSLGHAPTSVGGEWAATIVGAGLPIKLSEVLVLPTVFHKLSSPCARADEGRCSYMMLGEDGTPLPGPLLGSDDSAVFDLVRQSGSLSTGLAGDQFICSHTCGPRLGTGHQDQRRRVLRRGVPGGGRGGARVPDDAA